MKDNMRAAPVGGAAILMLLLSACGAPATTDNTTAEKPASPFTFKTLKVGMPLAEAKASGLVKGCEKHSEDTICHLTDERIGDLVIYDFQNSVYFTDKGFDWFYVRVHHSKFDQIAGDLASAFGEPCKANGVKLQNAFGATFDSDTVSWCFKEGDLTIERRAEDDINMMDLTFYRDRPSKPPKQYSPDTL